MAFLEIQLPTMFSLQAVGGPGYMTNVNSGFSGFEQRNQNWSQSLATWQVVFQSRPQAWYDAFQSFFHAVRGKANGFRMKWHPDCSATGQLLATGDGTTTAFQLTKTYTFPLSDFSVTRPIQKPVMSDVVDYLGNALTDTVVIHQTRNGVTTTLTKTTDYTVDSTTGIVTFTTAPRSAAQNVSHSTGTVADVITADYQFHYPVRLDVDQLQPKLETSSGAGILYTFDNLNLKEIRIALGASSG